MRMRGVALAIAGALTATLAACSSPGGGGSADGTGLVIGVPNEPDSLNPILGYGKDGSSKIFDGLLDRDANLQLVPALAQSLPEVSADGLTYTFRLRPDVTFSDGKPLTSADVAFTYRTILDPAVNTTVRSDIASLESVETPDPATVVFRLKYAYAPFPQRTTLGIVPEHVLAGTDVDEGPFNRRPVGTGPYVVDQWRSGDKLILKANPTYWGGEPKVRTLTIAFVTDDNVRATRLASGDLDGAALPPKLAERFRGDGKLVTYQIDSADYRGVMLPTGNPVTRDLAVRKALDLAVDRDAMVAGILAGAGGPAFGPVAPTDPAYLPDLARPADPAAAGRILDDAGWTRGGDGIRAKDGQRAAFTLMYPSGDNLRKDLALAYASDAKKLGIAVTLEGLSWDAIEPRMNADALLMGQGAPYDPDYVSYETFHSSLAGQAFNNPGHYNNAEVDRLLDAGRAERDPAARTTIYQNLQRELAADPAWTFLTYLKHVYVLRDGWNGISQQVEPHAHDFVGPWWNVETWVPKGDA